MVISGVDRKETAKLMKRQQRQIEELERTAKMSCSEHENDSVTENCEDDSVFKTYIESITEASTGNTFSIDKPSTSTANRNTLQLPTVSKVCVAYRLGQLLL